MEGDSVVEADADTSTLCSTLAQQDSVARQDEMHLLVQKQLAAAEILISEVEALFQALEPKVKTPILTGLPTFIRSLKREQTSLLTLVSELCTLDLEDASLSRIEKKLAAATATINHGSLHWAILKRSRSLVAVKQTFQSSSREHRRTQLSERGVSGRERHMLHRSLKEQGKIEVHVVDRGREWIDIRSLQQDRLARQMTDCGWAWGEHVRGDVVDAEEWEDIPLARHVGRLVAAAKMNRHQYHIPRLRVVLLNVSRGDEDMDVLLEQLSRMDPMVQVIVEDRCGSFMTTPPPTLETAIENLVGDELEGLTPMLNMDHTILIDLISDITHSHLQPQPWQAPTTRAQIEEERRHGGRMARTLYPLLADRALVCTREAADHFHELLLTVGTETEKQRGKLLVPLASDPSHKTNEATRQHFQSLTIHSLPATVKIPITVLAEDWSLPSIDRAVTDGRLPLIARDVTTAASVFQSGAKRAVFAYGWASGNVTLTSNKEISGQIRTLVEAFRHHDGEMGPAIWRVDVTRNLLAKSAAPPKGRDQAESSDDPG